MSKNAGISIEKSRSDSAFSQHEADEVTRDTIVRSKMERTFRRHAANPSQEG